MIHLFIIDRFIIYKLYYRFFSTAHTHTHRHRMKGHPVLWIPGLDHAGIATQAVVERTLQHTRKITRHDIGHAEFTRLIWQWKTEKATAIKEQLKTLGATLDWDREYFTIDEVIVATNMYCFTIIFISLYLVVTILLNIYSCRVIVQQ